MPKKTKSIKVSDKAKAWNRKKDPGIYKTESIPIRNTILIVCEGQTEQLYFESFPVLSLQVKCINLKGQSKTKLVESTQSIIESLVDKKYDEVWCVFDMDVKQGQKEFSDFDNAIVKANSLGYKVAYSNDSFELWFFLHYSYTDTKNLRGYYYEELSKRFNINYVEQGKQYSFCQKLYKVLLEDKGSSQTHAIERAKKIFEVNKHLPFHKQNPVTKVYELVEKLNENSRR